MGIHVVVKPAAEHAGYGIDTAAYYQQFVAHEARRRQV